MSGGFRLLSKAKAVRFVLFGLFAFWIVRYWAVRLVHLLVPQFVLLTFDGGLELNAWQRILAAADDSKAHVTFFVTGSFLLLGPTGDTPRSNVGFGGNDVQSRVAHAQTATVAGHEVAAHGTTHENGKDWSEALWAEDFQRQSDIMHRALGSHGPAFRGFRAPYLAGNANLATVEARWGMAFDSSALANRFAEWPIIDRSGVRFTIFPLTDSMGRRKSAMDYISYEVDGDRPGSREEVRADTLEMYGVAFDRLYSGNRAPFVILTHFGAASMNDWAYMEAQEQLAKAVCGRPMVRCATMLEAAEWIHTHWVLAWLSSQL